ncbi:MAG TPA: Gfo/Idh/MocA family oxidoreductase [Cyclobacteriaceae bacterium]|nr:Gfo/Idh/MocA family oxidoreductase [Cyclobacteriaceae bacterium]
MKKSENSSRRDFVKKSSMALLGGTVLAGYAGKLRAGNPGNGNIRVGLVGCGDRGTGAAVQAMMAAENIALTAMGDTFRDKLDSSYINLKQNDPRNQVKVADENKFTGFDSYLKVIDKCDAVILATPPPFRPSHFEAAIKAGKHVFMEKPLAVDVPGYHKIMEIGELANSRNVNVVVGLQFRYQKSFQELIKKIWDGAMGRVVSLDVYFNVAAPVIHERQQGWTEMEFQLRNWRYFTWLWGGQLAGQTIHQMDVMNWLMKDYPVSVKGIGGRQTFFGPNQGHTYDHHYAEFKYSNGVKMHVTGATMDRCWSRMGFDILGTQGMANERNMIMDLDGKIIWKYRDEDDPNAYEVEHQVFFDAINKGKHVNDTEFGAKSSLTTIMGRMAIHSGRELEIDDVLKSTRSILPEKFTWDAKMPVEPDENGEYPVDVPGKTEVL